MKSNDQIFYQDLSEIFVGFNFVSISVSQFYFFQLYQILYIFRLKQQQHNSKPEWAKVACILY